MINTQQIYNLLRPGIKAVIGDYKEFADIWKKMYLADTSKRAFEYEDEKKGLGFAKEKPQGSAIAQDDMSIMFQKVYVMKTYGNSFGITDEAMKDNQYQKDFPQQAKSLAKSLRALKNQLASNVLNLGATNDQLSIDGISLFNAAHPLANGDTCSNMSGVNAALSEIAIQDMYQKIMLFKDLSGIPTQVKPRLLVVHPMQAVAAETIFGSQFTTTINSTAGRVAYGRNAGDTSQGANDINIVSRNSIFPDGYEANPYITSQTGAFVTTDAERGLIYYEREAIDHWEWKDNNTKSLWFAASERYAFGASNWRGVYQISA